MGFHPQARVTGRKKGSRARSSGQLSFGQRRLLAWILRESNRINTTGLPEEKITLLNRGVPWLINAFCAAEDFLPASASRTLGRLEDREVIACFAEGTGRNRRVTHIKLSAEARRVASRELINGMTKAGHALRDAKFEDWMASLPSRMLSAEFAEPEE